MTNDKIITMAIRVAAARLILTVSEFNPNTFRCIASGKVDNILIGYAHQPNTNHHGQNLCAIISALDIQFVGNEFQKETEALIGIITKGIKLNGS